MKKIFTAFLATSLITLSPMPVFAQETEHQEVVATSPRAVAHQINKRISVGNGIYATISGMYTADSKGNILSIDLHVSSVTGNHKVIQFTTQISGKNIYYTLAVEGGIGCKVGFLL